MERFQQSSGLRRWEDGFSWEHTRRPLELRVHQAGTTGTAVAARPDCNHHHASWELQQLVPNACPETAAAFHAAANINQLTMMLNKATLAFQSQDFVTAGALVKWLIEVTPCDASSASADDVTRCSIRSQAAAINRYVVSGMVSRGSSLVLTPRSSLQLIQVYVCRQLLPQFAALEQQYVQIYNQSLAS